MNIKNKYLDMQKELLKEIIPEFEGVYEYEDQLQERSYKVKVVFKDFKITKSGNLYVIFENVRNDGQSSIRSESADDILSEKVTPYNYVGGSNKRKLENLQELKESYKVEDNGGGYIYIYDTDNDNIESGVDFDEIDLLDLMSGFDAEILVNDKAPWTKKLSILKAAAGETKAAYRSFGYGSKHNIKFNNVPENILKEWVDKCVKYFKELYPDIVKSLTENSLLDSKASQLKSLKESLSPVKFNKIQKLIKECLREGMEVEITIPKKRK